MSTKAHHGPADSPPLTLAQWDVPCLNCGRFGTIPGQMITDSFNNTFCSPDCGWSHLLRPIEQQRAAKAAAAAAGMRTGAAPRARRPSRRSSRSSRHPQHSQLPQKPHQEHRYRQRSHLVADEQDLHHSRPSHRDEAAVKVGTSGRKPPRLPSSKHSLPSSKPAKSGRRVEASERAAERCLDSGNAMFDFMMMSGMDELE